MNNQTQKSFKIVAINRLDPIFSHIKSLHSFLYNPKNYFNGVEEGGGSQQEILSEYQANGESKQYSGGE